MSVVVIEDLTKRYGDTNAVEGLSLSVAEGSVCGLLGPNGAGKSTTFRCLLGLARPTSGRIAIDGAPVSAATFEELAYVPDRNGLFDWMTVAQHLEWGRRTYRAWDGARARQLLDLFGIDAKKKVKRLSKGQQTSAMLVLAFAIRPRILVLDEPSSGLDPILQRVVLDLIVEAAAGGSTVLFSSHQIGQVERAADRVAILRRGRLVLDGDVEDLKSREKVVEAFFDREPPALVAPGPDGTIRRVERVGGTLRVFVSGGADALAARLNDLGARAVSIGALGLEDVFLSAVGALSSATPVRSDESVSGGFAR